MIAPHNYFNELNADIKNFHDIPLICPVVPTEWPRRQYEDGELKGSDIPWVGAVSSFGMSGTNVFALVQEYMDHHEEMEDVSSLLFYFLSSIVFFFFFFTSSSFDCVFSRRGMSS